MHQNGAHTSFPCPLVDEVGMGDPSSFTKGPFHARRIIYYVLLAKIGHINQIHVRSMMFRSVFPVVLVAAILSAPAITFAQQSNQPATRAQVRAELVELEKAGYNPARGEDPTYPADIQAAEAKVAAQRASANAYGGSTGGTSATGTSRAVVPAVIPVAGPDRQSLYSKH